MVNNLREHERDFSRGEIGDLDLNQWATLILINESDCDYSFQMRRRTRRPAEHFAPREVTPRRNPGFAFPADTTT
jgi:hypothetical protein